MLAEALAELRRRHPGLLIRVLAENWYSSLDHREAYIAARFGHPTSGDLTATKVGTVGHVRKISQWLCVRGEFILENSPHIPRQYIADSPQRDDAALS